jgi:hypothetical protein
MIIICMVRQNAKIKHYMSDKALFLDTLFIQATLNRRDQYHQQAQLILPRVRAAR